MVTASIVVVDGGGTVTAEHEWLADPGVEIPAEVTEIHGISTAHAREHGKPAAQVTAEVAQVLAGLFAKRRPGRRLQRLLRLHGPGQRVGPARRPPMGAKPVIDPYISNKQVHKYRKGSRTLTALCQEYGVALKDAHTSAADALATIRLAQALALKFPELQGDAHWLHEAQVGWAAAQAADFQLYLRRKNPAAVVEGHWPLLP